MTLTEATSADDLVRHLESGTADLALGPRPTRWTGASELVGTEEIVAVLPADHALARQDRLGFDDLHDQPVVHYHPDNGLAGWLDARAAVTASPSARSCAPGRPAPRHNWPRPDSASPWSPSPLWAPACPRP